MYDRPRLLPLGDGALTVEFADGIEDDALVAVGALDDAMISAGPPGIIEVIPTYRSLSVVYDPSILSSTALRRWVEQVRLERRRRSGARPTLVVPVTYGGSHGPDLTDVAEHCRLSESEVIRRHSGADYSVAMLGFQAGFPYLAGLPPELNVPRLASPRTTVPAGAVGIAGGQTGIYSSTSPGGWRIIGWTPLVLWDPGRDRPSLLEPGDRVRFCPVESVAASAQGRKADRAGGEPR
ncbi:MAG TPA: 5-oxoprolinase subunit PxpB [Bacillota bacterium]|jgi:KipI family sensor histidine kinase inhibitor